MIKPNSEAADKALLGPDTAANEAAPASCLAARLPGYLQRAIGQQGSLDGR